MTIRSKIHIGGDPKESEWPPRFGTNEAKGFHKVYGEYYKPNNFGQAPIAIMDSMPKTYHEGVCRHIESRKEWEMADKESGCITFGSQSEAERLTKKRLQEEKKALRADRRKASSTALQMHRENPKEMREKVAKTRELQESIANKEGLSSSIDKAVETSLKRIK